jgi:hypothetical protein
MPRTLRRPLPWILLGGLILVAGIGFALSRGLVNLTAVASPSTSSSATDGTPSSSGSVGASGSGSATPGAGSPSVTVGTTASPTVSTSPTGTPRTTPAATAVPATPAVTAQPTPIPPPPGGGGTAVLVGAGDISTGGPAEKATAALLAKIPGTVFTAGDNAYNDGSKTDYVHFNASWGAFKSRMRPAPGNHDYHLSPQYYYTYFGAAAGPPGLGYYVYALGAWRIYSLNGETPASAGQIGWLKNDLAAHPSACVLAYWHEPRFSSGQHGSDTSYAPFWDALYAARAEIIINGHDHDYERFAPQNPAGQASATGIREFVVGTGGAGLRGFTHAIANSEVRNGVTNGVLKLTLSPGHYGWQFIPVAGQSFTDSGQGTCH